MKFCPSCRKQYSDSVDWCDKCCIPLMPSVEMLECPHCGKPVPVSVEICPSCGEHMDDVEGTDLEQEWTDADASPSEAEDEPIQPPRRIPENNKPTSASGCVWAVVIIGFIAFKIISALLS